METTHVLSGRPWQYDRQVLHDGLTNKMTFNFQGHKVILKPLSPKEVHEDQIEMINLLCLIVPKFKRGGELTF